MLISRPISEEERLHLVRMGARLEQLRVGARLSRRAIGEATGLNPQSVCQSSEACAGSGPGRSASSLKRWSRTPMPLLLSSYA
jgi:hypothetical protein